MYYLSKEFSVEACHKLNLTYQSKCQGLHGHSWKFKVYLKGERLNENGMLYDFSHIKRLIHDKLDHSYLNDKFNFNTTSENMAKWAVDEINTHLREEENASVVCFRVDVQEQEGSIAWYEL